MLGKTSHFLVLLLLSVTAASVVGAGYTVSTLSDTHDILPGDGICADNDFPDSSFCSLRAALEEANASQGADTIIIPADTLPIRLYLGSLQLTTDSITIIGQNQTAIDAVNNPLYSPAIHILSNYNRLSGVTVKRSRYHGILIEGGYNIIGGASEAERNILIGNGIDNENACGIFLTGPEAVNNSITGNFIGVYGNGTKIDGNRNGIGLSDQANNNTVGGLLAEEINVISGNDYYGLVISDRARENQVLNNIIGPDITGGTGPGNGVTGIKIFLGAHHNRIGGDSFESGNHVSLNHGNGIEISGYETDYNFVQNNYIGTDITGIFPLPNDTAGVMITDGACYNFVGGTYDLTGNLISGNKGDGVRLSGAGTNYNIVCGNIIGVNYRISGYLSNGTDFGAGVTMANKASENIIGGDTEEERNVISGNSYYGVYLSDPGTSYNQIIGNYIGVNATGTSSLSNGSGVVIRNGALNNYIGGEKTGEGNLISGNRGDIFPFSGGVIIYDVGTAYNRVTGNLIGTSLDTTRALRNGIAGVIIGNGAQANIIGGDTPESANIISGNGSGSYLAGIGRGVHIFGEGTRANHIIGNYIGTTRSGDTTIGNVGHGVGLSDGAVDNFIGGESVSAGNIIAVNRGHGVFISGADTKNNRFRFNTTYDNDSLGITIRDSAQENIQPPVLTAIAHDYVSGHSVPPYSTVDIYLAATDPSGHGEGRELIGTDIADSLGAFKVTTSNIAVSDTVTALVTDPYGNSSEFSLNAVVSVFTDIKDSETESLPEAYDLSQNYPNPFNPVTRIEYNLPQTSMVLLTVYNTLGQRVKLLVDEYQKAGRYSVVWNGTGESGQALASGIYLYRLQAGSFHATRKMLLLK